MNRIALRPLLPVTASMLIHVGIAGVLLLVAVGEPARVPVLMAELVVAEPPPALEPRPPATPAAQDRRAVTPPRLVPPPPQALARPTPPRSEPEPPTPRTPDPPPTTAPEPQRVAAPEPPRVATSEPPPPTAPSETAVSAPAPMPSAGSSKSETGPIASAAPDGGASTFTLPLPSAAPSPAPPSSAPASVAAAPPAGVTQRAIPRGGYQVRPSYPATARNLGIQGTALLQVLVADDGRVAQVVVTQSAGHPDLDRAAVDAVRRWRFEPARRGAEPVEMWVQLPFEFRLR